MKIPQLLETAIENETKNIKITELKKHAQNLSNKYMKEERTGKSLVSKEIEALAYSIMRMPATFGAISTALKYALNLLPNIEINSVLDIGAGTGAAIWAINEFLNPNKTTCIEREQAMRIIGGKLLKYNNEIKNVEWIDANITNCEFPEKADLIIVSYMINELKPEEREKLIHKLLKIESKLILIIEPGTPEGFKNIKNIQKQVIDEGAYILAPCTMQNVCPLPEDDWCHTTVRIERTKIHKLLKDGDAPYEDEKFSYIAITKEKYQTKTSRILRHPIIEKGKITLKLCTNGHIEEKIVTKKEGEIFKQAKKKKCGDEL